jgi:hypothetical protein
VIKSFKLSDSTSKPDYLFDFGNEPVGWYGLQNFQPVGDVTKVLNFYTPKSQGHVVEELTRLSTNHEIDVIWGGEYGYWKWPFNGNWMKQYIISQHLLENYVPTEQNGGYTLMRSSTKEGPRSSEKALYAMKALDCNWEKGVQNFKSPISYSKSLEVPTEEVSIGLTTFSSDQISNLTPDIKSIGRNAIFVRISGEPTFITLKSKDFEGQIRFYLSENGNWNQVWLANCPVWKLQKPETVWTVNSSNPKTIIRIAGVHT